MQALKRKFLLNPRIIFLNHGSYGAVPREVFHAYQEWQRLMEKQPVDLLSRKLPIYLSEVRIELTNFLGGKPENLIFTTNVTEALNLVARSLPLGKGDEVLGTNHEYGAMDRMWSFLAREKGFQYLQKPISLEFASAQDFADALWDGVTSRTRVIFLSHITSPTALLFPIEDVIRRARAEDIITIIDGAHAPGQISLSLDLLGADFYCGNLHKWLCAPKGSGFLYVHPRVQEMLKPLIVSWGFNEFKTRTMPMYEQLEWTGTKDYSASLAIPAAINFHEQEQVKRYRAYCCQLISQVGEMISGRTGIAPLRKDIDRLQMISLPLPLNVDYERLKTCLYEKYAIEVPIFLWNNRTFIRVSLQVYNSESDVEKLINALDELGIFQ